MNQKVIAIIVAVIIILGGIYWVTVHNKAGAPSNVNTNDSAGNPGDLTQDDFVGDVPGDAPDTSNAPSTATVAVSTQVPGDSVTIDNVFLEKPGFVTIHEVDGKGQPGNIIGTSGLLGTGNRQDLEIRAAIKPGAKYIAQLREDNGDKKFNAQTDPAVMNKNIAVMTMFSVSQ